MGSPGNINNIDNIRSAGDIDSFQKSQDQSKFTFKVKIGEQSFKVWIPNTEDNKTDPQQKLFEVIQKVKAIKPAYETPETKLSEKFSSISFGKNDKGDATMKCVYKESYATTEKKAKWAKKTDNAPVEKDGKFEKTHVINEQKIVDLGKRLEKLSNQIKKSETNKSDVKVLEAKFARTQKKSFAFLNMQNIFGKSHPTESTEGTYRPMPRGDIQDDSIYGPMPARDDKDEGTYGPISVSGSQYEKGPVSSFQEDKQEVGIYGDTSAVEPPEGVITDDVIYAAAPPIEDNDIDDSDDNVLGPPPAYDTRAGLYGHYTPAPAAPAAEKEGYIDFSRAQMDIILEPMQYLEQQIEKGESQLWYKPKDGELEGPISSKDKELYERQLEYCKNLNYSIPETDEESDIQKYF